MPSCPKCGAKRDKDDKFCHSCGAPLTEEKKELPEREVCFGERERRRDYLGLVSFGIFLLIVGIVFLANPNIFSSINLWVQEMAEKRTLLSPRENYSDLIYSASLFFVLIGASNFFMAGVRLVSDKAARRVFADTLTGVALVLFGYLIYLYGAGTLGWQMVLAIEAVACGLLVILYSIIYYLFPKKTR